MKVGQLLITKIQYKVNVLKIKYFHHTLFIIESWYPVTQSYSLSLKTMRLSLFPLKVVLYFFLKISTSKCVENEDPFVSFLIFNRRFIRKILLLQFFLFSWCFYLRSYNLFILTWTCICFALILPITWVKWTFRVFLQFFHVFFYKKCYYRKRSIKDT